MKTILQILSSVVAILILTFGIFAEARDPATISNPRKKSEWVVDESGTLSREATNQLNSRLENLFRTSGVEFAVVIAKTIGDDTPKVFANALFHHWRIGAKDKNNGLLLLLVLDQHRSEVETGYGLEGVLPDALLSRFLREELTPRLKQGAFGEGLLGFTDRVASVVSSNRAEVSSLPKIQEAESRETHESDTFAIAFFLFAIVGIVALIVHAAFLVWRAESPLKMYEDTRSFSGILLFLTLVVECGIYAMNHASPHLLASLTPAPAGFLISWFGINRWRKSFTNKPRRCPKCSKEMSLLGGPLRQKTLTSAQLTEAKIQAYDFMVFGCRCGETLTETYPGTKHEDFTDCPQCQAHADHINQKDFVRAPTAMMTGENIEHHVCENCHSTRAVKVLVSALENSSSFGSSSGAATGSTATSSFSSDSSFGSDSSSGSSDFGGGNSGGGGAGDSW